MANLPESVPADPRYGNGVGKGWFTLVELLHDFLQSIDPDYKLMQVKEKFGSLRFYYYTTFPIKSPEATAMDRLVRFAEALSARTCEECGNPGEGRFDSYWIVTLCDNCYRSKVTGSTGNLDNQEADSRD